MPDPLAAGTDQETAISSFCVVSFTLTLETCAGTFGNVDSVEF